MQAPRQRRFPCISNNSQGARDERAINYQTLIAPLDRMPLPTAVTSTNVSAADGEMAPDLQHSRS